MMIFAPIIIIAVILLFSVGGNIAQTIKLPSLNLGFSTSKSTTNPTPTPSSQYRANPPSPQTQPTQPTPVADPEPPSTVSPYLGKVVISSVREKGSSSSSLITLRPSKFESQETIDLTGWKVQGNNGSFTIPLGITKFQPGIQDTSTEPIVITKSDTIYLSGAKSPFGIGRNFKPNICMGYLKSQYTFPISFSSSCTFQKPTREELLQFSQDCESFVLNKISFSSCTVPTYPPDPNILREGTGECAAYIQENFNYPMCFSQYQNTQNFLKNEWHIYMNQEFINSRYDILQLFDQNGFLVSEKIVP
jgi:hypothetical protein